MIGIFDSGLGGLTVYKAILEKEVHSNFIYLADTANAPYGEKTHEQVLAYSIKAIEFLFKQGCFLVIVACNTASASALRIIQREWLPQNYPDKKVLGVIIPTAEAVCELAQKNKLKVGIIGTTLTINSGKYEREIKKISPEIEIISQATPLLVEIIEAGQENKVSTREVLQEYLSPLLREKINILILGCTHYPFLEKQIKEIIGEQIKIINSPANIALKLKAYIDKHQILLDKKTKKEIFYVTGDEKKFKLLGEKFLGRQIDDPIKIKL